MAQDSDVARVAAALKAPGIRYKSFGNDPVRSTAQPVENVANSFPLLGAAMDTAAAAAPVSPLEPPADPQGATAPELASHAPPNAPEPAPRPHGSPPASFAPSPANVRAPPPGFTASPPPSQESGGTALGQFPFGASPAYPQPAAPHEAREAIPGFGAVAAPHHQPLSQASTYPQAPAAYGFGGPVADPSQSSYRLFESLDRQADPLGPVPQPPSYSPQGPGGTFGSLLGAETSAPMQSFGQPALPQSAFPHTGYGQSGPGPAGFSPPVLPTGNWPSPMPTSALLPAAMVTLPLAEVMRLVAVGAPVVSSPFAAFRVSGGVPNAR